MPQKKPQVSKTAKLNNPPLRQLNSTARTREYLTTQEIEKLRKAARAIGRHGHRDDTLILILFRHALRVGDHHPALGTSRFNTRAFACCEA